MTARTTTCASRLVEGAFSRSASPGHTSAAKLILWPLYVPHHNALTPAAACSMTRAALRQSAELRGGGLVTEPIHAASEGIPACARVCWLAAFTARPTARPTVR